MVGGASMRAAVAVVVFAASAACSAETEALRLPSPSAAPDPTLGCEFTARPARSLPEGTYVEPPFLVAGAGIVAGLRPLSGGSFDVFVVDPADAVTTLVGSPDDDLLIDASLGSLVVARGAAIVEVTEGGERALGRLEGGRWSSLGQPARRAIGSDFVAWIDPTLDAVMRAREGRLESVSQGSRRITALDVGGRMLAFLAESGQRLVVLRDDEITVIDQLGPALPELRIVREEVYWATADALYRWVDGSLERVFEGRCTLLASSGLALAAACAGSDGAPARRLIIVDQGGVSQHEVPQTITALALSYSLIAWTTHPSADCGEQPGRLLVRARAGGELGRVLIDTEVGAPCWCCDAYWPPPYLALSDEVVVWNYARVDRTRLSPPSYRRISATDVCPEAE